MQRLFSRNRKNIKEETTISMSYERISIKFERTLIKKEDQFQPTLSIITGENDTYAV